MGAESLCAQSDIVRDDKLLVGRDPSKTSYYGGCDELGRPNGQGEMYYASDGSTFKGTFENGRRLKGKLQFRDNRCYEGEFNERSQPHGQGIWKDATGTYTGIFKDSYFSSGQIQFTDKFYFKGTMLGGKKHGPNCEYIAPNGDSFKGAFEQDEFAEGQFESRDGVFYKGKFFQGQKQDQGRATYKVKLLLQYQGSFAHDQFDGMGTLKNLQKDTIYEGQFREGKKHGRGILRETGGATYEGQFEDNLKHGKGTYSFNGKTYVGEFQHNKFQGQGTLTYRGGDVYIGQFRAGKKEGQGQYELRTLNQSYKGAFKDDKIDGFGEMIYDNGDVYRGYFEQNKKNGQGTYFHKNKEQQVRGHWKMEVKDGQFSQENTIKNTRSQGSYVNGLKDGVWKISELRTGRQEREQLWAKGVLKYNQ